MLASQGLDSPAIEIQLCEPSDLWLYDVHVLAETTHYLRCKVAYMYMYF